MAEDLVGLIQDDLGAGSVTLVGHSMGGRTAMWTALNWPMIVDRLVVVDISPVNKEFDVRLIKIEVSSNGKKMSNNLALNKDKLSELSSNGKKCLTCTLALKNN